MNSLVDFIKWTDSFEILEPVFFNPPSEFPCTDAENLTWLIEDADISLPDSFLGYFKAYDWTKITLGMVQIFGDVNRLREENSQDLQPFYEELNQKKLYVIGHIDVDFFCLQGACGDFDEGSIVLLNIYSQEFKPISDNFEQFLLGVATQLDMKARAKYFDWQDQQQQDRQHPLYQRIFTELNKLGLDTKIAFWEYLVYGVI